MQHSGSNSSMTDFQKLWARWDGLVNRFNDDPKVAWLMETRIGQYLSSQPVLALAGLMFSAMAALPVGIFLSFALVTIVMSVVGFVFFEMFLLFIGGMILMCVLPGIALFSVMVAFISNALYVTSANIFNCYYLTKGGKVLDDHEESMESKYE
ncbi:lipid droplet assembly factor 1-like isoform X2 [Pseudoliparis swirei]|uniref:lipid droplet assembly factor 1-like isoform X2 n=1 Tax=Pseudoliparis swirei TaxID=2059687 RepID=UPI0024BE2C0E|nr:lipid droplet assembly factor 1-like isoform X2 [Pseudoliparis swirei]